MSVSTHMHTRMHTHFKLPHSFLSHCPPPRPTPALNLGFEIETLTLG